MSRRVEWKLIRDWCEACKLGYSEPAHVRYAPPVSVCWKCGGERVRTERPLYELADTRVEFVGELDTDTRPFEHGCREVHGEELCALLGDLYPFAPVGPPNGWWTKSEKRTGTVRIIIERLS